LVEKNYLPIGSVCTLRKNNKKVMVVGYFPVECGENTKIFMYKGIPYPKGMSSDENKYSFNNEDIANIDFTGFMNEDYEKLNEKLLKIEINKIDSLLSETNNSEDDLIKKITNYQFDENGTVIGVSKEKEDTSSNLKSKYQFDENGIVIGVNNPFNEYKNNPVEELDKNTIPDDSNEWDIFKEYKFDENGTVIGVEEVKRPKNSSNLKSEQQSTENNETKVSKSKYQFDENGTVIGVGEEKEDTSTMEPTPSIENKEVETSKPKYQFDENGTVIGVDG